LVAERTPVAIYLVNGIRLHGCIADFDRFGVLLKSVGQQLVYKQSISTILIQDVADKTHSPVPDTARHEPPAPIASSSEPTESKPTTARIVLKPRKRPGTP
jgi:host factor-I protein